MTGVGVVGAGVMGIGVADNLARSGHDVTMVDLTDDILARALRDIRFNCRASALGGGPAVDVAAVMDRISVSRGLEALKAVDFVIENVVERREVKREVHAELDRVCPPSTVVIVNTSAIPITEIASAGDNPGRVIGVHFMNPVPSKDAVELIEGTLTAADTVTRTLDLLATMGKRAIRVQRDTAGFISNYLLMQFVNSAACLVERGVATAADIDDVCRSCFGHPLGPLQEADLIGVGTIYDTLRVLCDEYGDAFRPTSLMKNMADAGFHGRRSGKGFYSYGGV
jgi:3-hydroxybutyryl-CoA dehydrogenase